MMDIDNVEWHLRETLTVIEDITPQDQKEDLDGCTAAELARLQAEFDKLNDLAGQIKTIIGKFYDHIRISALPEQMEEEGLGGMKVDGVGRVILTSDINVKTKDKTKAYEWLEEEGHGDLVTETVNASSLKALLRRRLRDGEEVPEDVFEVKPLTRASINKS